MARVFIPIQIAKLTGGARVVEVSGATLGEVIDALDGLHPGIRDRLVEDGRLRAGLAAAVDNVLAPPGLGHTVGPESEVIFLPALRGG
ncbi:MAG: MoaD/ThiS family protein [Planctomycetes bacterium]|nr:MoaD/ThiS family protein [Planctomycetota bacterium]